MSKFEVSVCNSSEFDMTDSEVDMSTFDPSLGYPSTLGYPSAPLSEERNSAFQPRSVERSCMMGFFFTLLRLAMLVFITTGGLLIFLSLTVLSTQWKDIYSIELGFFTSEWVTLVLVFGVILILQAFVGCFFSMLMHKRKLVWTYVGVLLITIVGLVMLALGGFVAQSCGGKQYDAALAVSDEAKRADAVTDLEIETARAFNLQYCQSALAYYCLNGGGRVSEGVDLFFPEVKELVGDSANQVQGIMKYCLEGVPPGFIPVCERCEKVVKKYSEELYIFTDDQTTNGTQRIQNGCQKKIDNKMCVREDLNKNDPITANSPYFECREKIWEPIVSFGKNIFIAGILISGMSIIVLIFVIVMMERP